MKKLSSREKSVLTGLYLSKFDLEGVHQLGFSGFTEAFNVLGHSLGIRPASLKNYRDEFDPLFPNERKGWHKRPIREYCKAIYDSYHTLNFREFSGLLKEILYKAHAVDVLMETIETEVETKEESYAKRLLTGQAAEEYFKGKYREIDIFRGYEIEDTTQLGCGFDFRLIAPDSFYVIEVKGLSEANGNITLTEKEHSVSEILRDMYFLFVVKNFREEPFHEMYQDPLSGGLLFSHIERLTVERTWVARV